MTAVALLDGQVLPAQYGPERILSDDVQALLRKVSVRPVEEFSRQFPARMPSRVRIVLRDGRTLVREKGDYEGFWTRPMSWEGVVAKFDGLSAPYADAGLRRQIVAAVENLDGIRVADLTQLLAQVRRPV